MLNLEMEVLISVDEDNYADAPRKLQKKLSKLIDSPRYYKITDIGVSGAVKFDNKTGLTDYIATLYMETNDFLVDRENIADDICERIKSINLGKHLYIVSVEKHINSDREYDLDMNWTIDKHNTSSYEGKGLSSITYEVPRDDQLAIFRTILNRVQFLINRLGSTDDVRVLINNSIISIDADLDIADNMSDEEYTDLSELYLSDISRQEYINLESLEEALNQLQVRFIKEN